MEVDPDWAVMTSSGRRRLSEARKERARTAFIEYSMLHRVDPCAVDGMPGEQSWYIRVAEHPRGEPFGRLAIHRVLLNNGYDLHLMTDSGMSIPGSPVLSVVEWDQLRPEVCALRPDRNDFGDPGMSLLVVEPVELDMDWQGMGAGELLLAGAMAELRTDSDTVAVVEPVPWQLKGRARTAPAGVQKPIFEHLGFDRFRDGTWILTDWEKLEVAHERYKRRFGFERPGLTRADWVNI